MPAPWGHRFFSTTRGKIVTLLRRSGLTVDELAQHLGLTDNAVRAHLSTLERDGLVQQRGVRRGQGKPSYCYYLTPDAEQLFPRPYATVLRHTLDMLAQRLAPGETRRLMRALGQRLAGGQTLPGPDLRSKVLAATQALNGLGALAEMEERDGAIYICSYSCPLAEVVPGHPETCLLVESLVASWLDVPVWEECERGTPLLCLFKVSMEEVQPSPEKQY